MSLVMYRNGLLTADRRVTQINMGGDYDALNNFTKLYFSEDKSILMAGLGTVPSQAEFEDIHKVFSKIKDPADIVGVIRGEELRNLMVNGMVIYVFYLGNFFIVRKEDDVMQHEFCDLFRPRVSGSGQPSALVLIRSGKEFTSKEFYRIVATATESVSTVFDEVDITQVKGFKK